MSNHLFEGSQSDVHRFEQWHASLVTHYANNFPTLYRKFQKRFLKLITKILMALTAFYCTSNFSKVFQLVSQLKVWWVFGNENKTFFGFQWLVFKNCDSKCFTPHFIPRNTAINTLDFCNWQKRKHWSELKFSKTVLFNFQLKHQPFFKNNRYLSISL